MKGFFFFISTVVLLVVLLSISLYFLKLIVWKTIPRDGNKQLPPGRTGWPVVGEGLELLRATRNGAPEKFFYDRMQKYSSEIFRTSFFGETITVMCGAASNKFLFSNEYKLVSTWWAPAMRKIFHTTQRSATVDGEAEKLRKLSPKFFNLEALQKYISTMDTMTKEYFEASWDNMEEFTVYPLVKKFTFSLACRLLMSLDEQARVDELYKSFAVVVNGFLALPMDLPGTTFHRAIIASNMIRKELLAIMNERKVHLSEKKASPTQDIMSQMIQFCEDDQDGNEDGLESAADIIFALLVGGHDTITSVITVVMKYLAELPHIYNKVLIEQTEIAKSKASGELLNWDDLQKMRYSWNVACEAMRLAPPPQGGFRQAITDFSYDGYFIPKGWKIYWSSIATHMNPKYFPNPEKFDPSRFEGDGPAPYTFIPFGGGPGMCPGKEYARLKILVFMHHLVRRYKWEKLIPNDKKIIYQPFPLPTKGLPIRLQPHKNKTKLESPLLHL